MFLRWLPSTSHRRILHGCAVGATLAGPTIPSPLTLLPCGSFHESPCDVSVSTRIQARLAFSFSPIRVAPAVRCAPKNIEAAPSTRIQTQDLRMYKRRRLANLIGTKGVPALSQDFRFQSWKSRFPGLRVAWCGVVWWDVMWCGVV